MCWNKEVSLGSYLIICGISYLLYERNLPNDRLLAFFIISYGTMQLFEFFIWVGIDNKKEKINKIASIFASLLLYIHPLAICLGMKYDKLFKKYNKNFYYNVIFIISILFVLFGIINIIYELKANDEYKFISYPDKKNCHLVWDFPGHYPIVLIISLFLSIFVFIENKIFWICGILYFLLPPIFIFFALKNNTVEKNKEKNYIGSYWCWYVAAFSFILYFLNPKIQK